MEFHIWCNKREARMLAPLTIVEDGHNEFIITVDIEEETVTRSSQDTEVIINFNKDDINKLIRSRLYGLDIDFTVFRTYLYRGLFREFVRYAESVGQGVSYAYFIFKLHLVSGEEKWDNISERVYSLSLHNKLRPMQAFEFFSHVYQHPDGGSFESVSLNTEPTDLNELLDSCIGTMAAPPSVEKGIHYMLQDWGVVIAKNSQEAIDLWVNYGAVVTASYDKCTVLYYELNS